MIEDSSKLSKMYAIFILQIVEVYHSQRYSTEVVDEIFWN